MMNKSNSICAILNSNKSFDELSPLSNNRSVSSLPFACRYRVIDFMLSNVFHADINSVSLFIDTSGRSLYDHIRGALEWNLNNSLTGGLFTFSQQNWKREKFIEGKQEKNDRFYNNHRTFMRRANTDYVIVMSGEHIVNIDIKAVEKYFVDSKVDASIVYKNVDYNNIKNHQDIKLVEINDDGLITNFDNKDVPKNNVNLNLEVIVLKVETLDEILSQAEDDKYYEDIGTVIHKYLGNYIVNGFEYTGYHAIIDSVNTYYKHNMDMLNNSLFNSLFHSSLSIITRTKNGTPTFYCEESNVKETLCATGCDLYGTVEKSLIFRDVLVDTNANVSDSIILPRVIINKGATIKYAILDKGVVVDENVNIIGSPDNLIVVSKNTHVKKEINP